MNSANWRGLLPFAGEDEAAFMQRIADCKMQEPCQDEALALCEKLFAVRPDWVSIVEKQKGLKTWQGAVTWIEEGQNPSIQISPRLYKSYSKQEVIAHELIHAVRLPLNSSRFEEMFAYSTSHGWRRFLGPIVRQPYEVYVLFGALGLSWSGIFALMVLPWCVCLFGILRLLYTRRTFQRCAQMLEKMVADQAMPLMLRLNDEEIALCARASFSEILDYMRTACKSDLRWKILSSTYFNANVSA